MMTCDIAHNRLLALPDPARPQPDLAAHLDGCDLCTRYQARLLALADDSGLSVSALDGAPGIFSARWAGPGKDFNMAMGKVEERVEESGSEDLSCWFTSALAVAWPNGPAVVVEGRVDGTLTFPMRGTRGFGYDPIFTPWGFDQTFGEMDPAAKDAMSHRALAFAKLKAAIL